MNLPYSELQEALLSPSSSKKRGRKSLEVDSSISPKLTVDSQQAKLLSMAGYGTDTVVPKSPQKREPSGHKKSGRKSGKESPSPGFTERTSSPSPMKTPLLNLKSAHTDKGSVNDSPLFSKSEFLDRGVSPPSKKKKGDKKTREASPAEKYPSESVERHGKKRESA